MERGKEAAAVSGMVKSDWRSGASSLGVPILQRRRRDDAAEDTWGVQVQHDDKYAHPRSVHREG